MKNIITNEIHDISFCIDMISMIKYVPIILDDSEGRDIVKYSVRKDQTETTLMSYAVVVNSGNVDKITVSVYNNGEKIVDDEVSIIHVVELQGLVLMMYH